ncbi:MAG TPA: branched-chain amino acid transaminase [Vicinamibacteria bacterium]
MRSKQVWMNGRLVPTEQATVPFLNTGLHYGLAVFEGIRAYRTARGPAVFRLREHVARLMGSAQVLALPAIPWSEAEILEAVRETVAANGFEECYVRPLIYVSEGAWNLDVGNGKASLGIAVWEWGPYLGAEAREMGVRANVSSFTRHHPNVMMTKAKISGNYANSALAKTESVRLGFDEAIMLDPSGFVAECTGENLFLVRDGAIVTTPTATILEGITRDSIITLARDLGRPVREEPVSRDQLYLADEAFVCGTAAELVALREIDGRPIGSGRTGPVTRGLQQAFHEAVHGENARYEKWLTYVQEPAAKRALA